MQIRCFQIRSPRPDFTGHLGGISFADGVARVSFDDERDAQGACMADEHQVQVGRAAVIFAYNSPGYSVVEVDEAGRPLPEVKPEPAPDQPELPGRSASKTDWVMYASSPAGGMTVEAAEALTRDDLAERFLGPKGA